jgi:hypothetical protein
MQAPAAARAVEARRSFADFRPSRHGFRFVNSFTGSALPLSLPATEKRLGLPDRFGLCGGMSCAAADFFLASREVPQVSTPPGRGEALYDFLYQRQLTTFAPAGAMALKFVEWMDLPEEGPSGTRARTQAELPEITAALGRGEPVILGLVLVARGDGQKAWENHQVLAYSAERLPMDVLELRIYDPNFPGRDDVVVRVAPHPEGPRLTRLLGGGRGIGIRGLFRMPYVPLTPPGALAMKPRS